jgi:hypothetical protein
MRCTTCIGTRSSKGISVSSVGFYYSSVRPSMALKPFVGPWPLIQFRIIFYTDSRIPWTGDQPVAKLLPAHRTTQTQNNHTQTFIS